MSIGSVVFLTFTISIAVVLLSDAAMTWFLRRVVWRGIQSTVVDKSDAEALLGRWHKGWRLWLLRLSSFLVIAAMLWAVIPRPQSAGKWTAAQGVDQLVDKSLNAVKNRIPGNGPKSQRVRHGLDRGAEKAKALATPK